MKIVIHMMLMSLLFIISVGITSTYVTDTRSDRIFAADGLSHISNFDMDFSLELDMPDRDIAIVKGVHIGTVQHTAYAISTAHSSNEGGKSPPTITLQTGFTKRHFYLATNIKDTPT